VPPFIFSAIEIIGTADWAGMMAVGAGLQIERIAQTKCLLIVGVLTNPAGRDAAAGHPPVLAGRAGRAAAHHRIITGAVPTASTAYVMARKMGGDAQLMANIVTFQVVAAVTLPVFIYIAGIL
jgi:malonate transporter